MFITHGRKINNIDCGRRGTLGEAFEEGRAPLRILFGWSFGYKVVYIVFSVLRKETDILATRCSPLFCTTRGFNDRVMTI